MTTDAKEDQHRLRENMANIASRWAVPVMLGLGGWFIARAIDRYADEQIELRTMAERNTTKLVAIESDLRDLNTRFNTLVIRRIDEHELVLERLDARVRSLEQPNGGDKP